MGLTIGMPCRCCDEYFSVDLSVPGEWYFCPQCCADIDSSVELMYYEAAEEAAWYAANPQYCRGCDYRRHTCWCGWWAGDCDIHLYYAGSGCVERM